MKINKDTEALETAHGGCVELAKTDQVSRAVISRHKTLCPSREPTPPRLRNDEGAGKRPQVFEAGQADRGAPDGGVPAAAARDVSQAVRVASRARASSEHRAGGARASTVSGRPPERDDVD